MRFRLAVASALGISLFLIVYTVLIAWAVNISTSSALRERQAMATQIALMMDDFVGLARRQFEIFATQFNWDGKSPLSRLQAARLTNLVKLVTTVEGAGVVDSNGKLAWSTGKLDGKEWEATVAKVLISGSPAMASALGIQGRADYAVIVTPLHDEAGVMTGALVASVGYMGTEILPWQQSGLLAQVVDREGDVLASSDESDMRLRPGHYALLKDAMEKGVPKAAIHEEENQDGHVVAFAPFDNGGGGIVLEEPADAALAVPRSVQRVGLIIGLAMLFAFSLGIWRYIGRISRPFEDLSTAAKTMAQSNFDQVIAVKGEDEIGVLAWSLEEMRVSLRASWEERQEWLKGLERRVEERTQEVHRLVGKIISAQEDERKRVARELHDGLAQYLAILLVSLDRLELLPREIDKTEQELWHRVRDEARMALAEVRRLISDLRPAALDDLGLISAIRWYAETRLRAVGVSLRLEVSGDERDLGPYLESTLFRIAQEAVSNVVKHANATMVHLQLVFREDNVTLVVQDNGRGFDTDKANSGLGLTSMKERTSLASGTFLLRSKVGAGARITVTIPTEGNNGAN